MWVLSGSGLQDFHGMSVSFSHVPGFRIVRVWNFGGATLKGIHASFLLPSSGLKYGQKRGRCCQVRGAHVLNCRFNPHPNLVPVLLTASFEPSELARAKCFGHGCSVEHTTKSLSSKTKDPDRKSIRAWFHP